MQDTDIQLLSVTDVVKRAVDVSFIEFRDNPSSATAAKLNDATAAMVGIGKLDGLQIEKLYAETPVRYVCRQIREWTAPRPGDDVEDPWS